MAKKNRREETLPDKDLFETLLYRANKRGYKNGWASHQFKHYKGDFPPNAWFGELKPHDHMSDRYKAGLKTHEATQEKYHDPRHALRYALRKSGARLAGFLGHPLNTRTFGDLFTGMEWVDINDENIPADCIAIGWDTKTNTAKEVRIINGRVLNRFAHGDNRISYEISKYCPEPAFLIGVFGDNGGDLSELADELQISEGDTQNLVDSYIGRKCTYHEGLYR